MMHRPPFQHRRPGPYSILGSQGPSGHSAGGYGYKYPPRHVIPMGAARPSSIPGLPVLHPRPGSTPEMFRAGVGLGVGVQPKPVVAYHPPLRKSMRLRCRYRIIADVCMTNGNISERDTDVTFICSNGTIKAHKIILGTACKMFADMFDYDPEKLSTVHFPDVTAEVLRPFLTLFYTERVTLTQNEIKDVLALFPTFGLSQDLFTSEAKEFQTRQTAPPADNSTENKVHHLERSFLVIEKPPSLGNFTVSREGEHKQDSKFATPRPGVFKKRPVVKKPPSIESNEEDDNGVNKSSADRVVSEWVKAVATDVPSPTPGTSGTANVSRRPVPAFRKILPKPPQPGLSHPPFLARDDGKPIPVPDNERQKPGGIKFIYICDKCETISENLTKAQVHYHRVCFPQNELPFERTVTRYRQGYYGQSKCPFCPKRFISNFSWTVHCAQMHRLQRGKFMHNNADDSITCKNCLSGFSFPADFKYHFTLEGNICGSLGLEYPSGKSPYQDEESESYSEEEGVETEEEEAQTYSKKIKRNQGSTPTIIKSSKKAQEDTFEDDEEDYVPPPAKKVKTSQDSSPGTKKGICKTVKKIVKKHVEFQVPKKKPENVSLAIGRSSRIAKRRSQEAEENQKFEPAECPLCGSVEDKIGDHIEKEHSDLNLNVIRVSDNALRCLRCQTSFAICDLVSHGAFCEHDNQDREERDSPPALTPIIDLQESRDRLIKQLKESSRSGEKDKDRSHINKSENDGSDPGEGEQRPEEGEQGTTEESEGEDPPPPVLTPRIDYVPPLSPSPERAVVQPKIPEPSVSSDASTQENLRVPEVGESSLELQDYAELASVAVMKEALHCRVCGLRSRKLGIIADCYKSHKFTRCPICFNTYKDREMYMKHLEICHKDDGLLCCPVCDKKGFPTLAILAVHQYNVHWLDILREIVFNPEFDEGSSTVEKVEGSSSTNKAEGSSTRDKAKVGITMNKAPVLETPAAQTGTTENTNETAVLPSTNHDDQRPQKAGDVRVEEYADITLGGLLFSHDKNFQLEGASSPKGG